MNITFKLNLILQLRGQGDRHHHFEKAFDIVEYNYKKLGLQITSVDGFHFNPNINLLSDGMEIKCHPTYIQEKFSDLKNGKYFNPFNDYSWAINGYSPSVFYYSYNSSIHSCFQSDDHKNYKITFDEWLKGQKGGPVGVWGAYSKANYLDTKHSEFNKMKEDLQTKAQKKLDYYFNPTYRVDAMDAFSKEKDRIEALGWVQVEE